MTRPLAAIALLLSLAACGQTGPLRLPEPPAAEPAPAAKAEPAAAPAPVAAPEPPSAKEPPPAP